jgi:NADH-quinone oxidoreductase subunit M
MILGLLILILLCGGLAAWISGKFNPVLSRVISLAAISADLVIVLIIAIQHPAAGSREWMIEYTSAWVPRFGIGVHLALDGLSLLMLILTFFIGILAVLISWNEIKKDTGFFHFNILWILAGIAGVFLSIDLFLFYFFWEVMLVPMYFLIGIWGHENRIYASYKFFIFTQASGLLMFLAIIALYLLHGNATGEYTFDYEKLLGTVLTPATEAILMAGFLAAFLVKLPAFPFHNWLPDAHTEAPTAGSLILASLMLKTGAYGLIRYAVPLFPNAAASFAPAGMILGVAGILYGAKLAYAQTDLKRLVAYTSVSHMGFVLLGVFAFNELAYQGVVMQMIAHGISTGALFVIVGQLDERLHTRNLEKMGGLWEKVPALGVMGLIFSLASLGLPGLGNFVAEFLTLLGVFKASVLFTVVASLGLIASTIYSLRIMQKVFYGKPTAGTGTLKDINFRESLVLGSLVIAILITGLIPQPVIDTAKPAIEKTIRASGKLSAIDNIRRDGIAGVPGRDGTKKRDHDED